MLLVLPRSSPPSKRVQVQHNTQLQPSRTTWAPWTAPYPSGGGRESQTGGTRLLSRLRPFLHLPPHTRGSGAASPKPRVGQVLHIPWSFSLCCLCLLTALGLLRVFALIPVPKPAHADFVCVFTLLSRRPFLFLPTDAAAAAAAAVAAQCSTAPLPLTCEQAHRSHGMHEAVHPADGDELAAADLLLHLPLPLPPQC